MGELRPVLERLRDEFTPPPDGFERLVALRSRKHRRQRLAAGTMALVVAMAGLGLATWAFRAGEKQTPQPTTTVTNGRIAFAAFDGATWQIYTAEPDGTSELQITTLKGEGAFHPEWSPDGRRLAFTVQSDGRSNIYTIDADGTGFTRLTDDGGSHLPSWSPDGTRLAYSRAAGDGTEDIWIMKADGTSATQITQERDGAMALSPSWSPDGTHIVFVSNRSGTPQIYQMDARGDAVTQLTTDDGFHAGPDYSPDGTRIAFAGDIGGPGLFTMVVDGSGVERLTDEPQVGPLSLAWAPDSRFIVYSTTDESGNVLVVVDVATRDGTTLVQARHVCCPTWQPLTTAAAPVEPSPMPDPVPTEPTAVDVRVSTTTGIVPFPSGVVAGEGGVWVGARRNDGSGAGDVVRLDPATGEIVARIPVRSLPGWEVGAAGITVGLGSVWLVGGTPEGDACCSALVSRIDPSTNALIDEIAIPDVLFGADVWVDQTGLYVLSFIENEPVLDLASLDPETHEVRWRVSLPAQWSQTVFVSGGSVWVLGTAPDARGPVEVNTLYRLDPVDGGIIAEIPLRNSMYAPAPAPGVLWLRTLDGALRFDPVAAQPIGEPIQPAPGCCTGAFVSDGEGGVWVISSPRVDTERGVWHIDVSGRIAEVGEVADREQFQLMLGQGYAFDPVTRTIWVQHYTDSVSRVELVSVGGS